MKRKYLLLLAFVFVAAVQIYVPASMIIESEDILKSGKAYKFKTTPVDPNDPFRGKYITLGFEQSVFKIKGETEFMVGEDIFVLLYENEEGFAEILDLSDEALGDNVDFVRAKVRSVSSYNESTSIFIDYPFDRFYMEENKAPIAEETFNKAQRDSDKITYAIVKIKDGNAALEDVMIDGKSLKEIIDSGHTK